MNKKLEQLKNKKKKGFTLIELIVVIAILAILAAIAIPAYNGLRKQSAQAVAKSNAQSVYTAATAYVATQGNTSGTTTINNGGLSSIATFDAGTKSYNASVKDGVVTQATWVGNINGTEYTSKYAAGSASVTPK